MRDTTYRVVAINDLSGFGRGSLTTIIPILSVMGLQVCPIPTALLSTHTGGFSGYSYIDLTDEMSKIINHWDKLNIEFECIYSGFLGSISQIDIVANMIDKFKGKSKYILVDPVMADNGKLYETFDASIIEHIKKLVNRADIITPNITEAAFLLNKEYPNSLDDDELKNWLIGLSSLGPNTVIITSTPLPHGNSCVATYDKQANTFYKVKSKFYPGIYPGTGDMFASVLIGCLLNSIPLANAIEAGVLFVLECVKSTFESGAPNREGVQFEKHLNSLSNIKYKNNYEEF